MINKHKVVSDIHCDGKYDAILDTVKKTLDLDNPSLDDVKKLIEKDEYFIKEYKNLNRWGELSSIHIKSLDIKDTDTVEIKSFKEKINKDVLYLKNNEEYEIASKKVIYLAWTGFIAIPMVYVLDNIVRGFTHLYITNPNNVYLAFATIFLISGFGYIKVVKNHTAQHTRYIQTQKEIRELVKLGLKNNYFTFNEIYEGEAK